MTARLLEGRPVADAIWASVSDGAREFTESHGRAPRLALVCGEDGAAVAYATQIERAFGRRGLDTWSRSAPSGADPTRSLLQDLSADRSIDGILLLAPLPGNLSLDLVVGEIDPAKDVDGQHPWNAGLLAQRAPRFVPSTALGGIRLLQHYQVPLEGSHAVVVGRSTVVGLPLALLLLQANATVSVCHSRTPDLANLTRSADLLCVAAGRPGLVGAEHVRPGATVLDFGTNPAADGSLVGDVGSDAAENAAALTPVPGGTGPVTVAVLAEQTLRAATMAQSR